MYVNTILPIESFYTIANIFKSCGMFKRLQIKFDQNQYSWLLDFFFFFTLKGYYYYFFTDNLRTIFF